jgi:transcriptional regulator with XRE-family HTH domain
MTYFVKEYRLKNKYTMAVLSKLSGVSTSMISEIETGKKHPTVLILCKLSKALDVEISDLFRCP